MAKKQSIKYILCDIVSAMLSWSALFLFRKVFQEPSGLQDVNSIFGDTNFWLGLFLVPLGWLTLYTIQGAYRNVLRKARMKELLETLIASVIGVVVIFFALLIDDNIVTYRNYYSSFLFLFCVHFAFTYSLRLILTSHTVHKVHTRQIGFPTLMIGSKKKAYQTYLDLENQDWSTSTISKRRSSPWRTTSRTKSPKYCVPSTVAATSSSRLRPMHAT